MYEGMTLYYDVMIFIWCEAVIEREKIAKVIENDRQAHTHTQSIAKKDFN